MLRTLRIIVACTFSCSLIHAGRISFRAPQTLSLGSVSAETFGDFHKNGRQDLMVVSFGAGLELYPNVGHGRFGTPAAILPVLTGFTPRVVAADFNQDGKLDVALLTVGEQNAATVTVLLGNGDGTFQAPTVYATGTLSGGGALLAGDFNRDGHLDLAVGGDSIQVLEGKGDGTFTGPVETPLGGATVSSMTAADFNRDGKLDLAVCASVNLTAYSLSIYTGKGDGTFQPPASAIASGPTAAASGDLNGDGLADLAAADPNNGGSVQVFLANGDGTFQLPANYPLATGHDLLNGEGAIYVVDANQDGHLDIVNGTYLFPGAIDGGLVTTFLGRGDGTFQPGVTSLKGEEVLTMAVADFNGDGYPDLAFAGELCCVSVAAGSGSGRFESSALYPVPEYARAVFAADFQGAGQIDLALLTPPHLDLYPGTANGTFGAPLASTVIAEYGVVADFNGDGVADLAVTGNNPKQMQVFFGTRNANFSPGPIVSLSLPVASIASADVNGDGVPDIALSTTSSRGTPGGIQVLLGDGKGNFKVSETIPVTGANFGQIVAGDFNGDGTPDLAVADRGSSSVFALFLGNGDGTFQPPVRFGSGTSGTAYLAVGDFNGDGKLDVAASDANLGNIYVDVRKWRRHISDWRDH